MIIYRITTENITTDKLEGFFVGWNIYPDNQKLRKSERPAK